MNVLSLCDGMSGGQIALKEIGIGVDYYFASEIDINAIKVTQDYSDWGCYKNRWEFIKYSPQN